MFLHICNPGTCKAEAGRWKVESQLGLSKQKKEKKKKKVRRIIFSVV